MTDITGLVPHGGAMVLLEQVVRWDAQAIVCRTRSHLHAGNPLRSDDRLAACCAVEYGLQAAALHGALVAGGVVQDAGYVAGLRAVALRCDRLDDPGLGTLEVSATLIAQERFGMVYDFAIIAEAGAALVTGRASISLPL